jgi:hypothetical protein
MTNTAPSDLLEFAEKKADATLELLRASYDDLHDRTHKVLTGLLGGAGAVGAYALGTLSKGGDHLQGLPLGVLACAWFIIALRLALRAATSRELSPGNGPDNIRNYYAARLAELGASDSAESEALNLTRRAELDLQQKRIREYSTACSVRAEALDFAYKASALSPAAPIATLAVIALIHRWIS